MRREEVMQTEYNAEMKPKLGTKLSQPVAVWEFPRTPETYAVPLASPWDRAQPILRNQDWRLLGVLPEGTPITNGKFEGKDHDVRCTLAGALVLTPHWALE
jgi:hypothetical protein